MKFDKVIMNPPYHIGGKIWDKARTKGTVIVCLMPLSNYKFNKRYLYIKEIVFIKNNFDASISDNNCISLSEEILTNNKYEHFLLKSFNPNYKLFYEYNLNYFKGFFFKDIRKVSYKELDINKDFIESDKCCSPKKVGGTGFGKNGCGFKFNVLKYGFEDCWIVSMKKIQFNTPKEKNNFSKWWYSAPKEKGLCSKVLIGINMTTLGYYHSYAIPQIDWENISDHPLWKEGKYDEAVLDAMGLRWEDNSKTKIIKKD